MVAIIAAGGWRWVFFALAVLSVLIPLPMIVFLMKDHPRQKRLLPTPKCGSSKKVLSQDEGGPEGRGEE